MAFKNFTNLLIHNSDKTAMYTELSFLQQWKLLIKRGTLYVCPTSEHHVHIQILHTDPIRNNLISINSPKLTPSEFQPFETYTSITRDLLSVLKCTGNFSFTMLYIM